jgi:hypothetical protein
MHELPRSPRLGAGLIAVSLLLVACSAAATPPTSPPASAPPDTTVTAPPSDGSGGSEPGGIGGGNLVVPKPGQLDVHDIPADSFDARVDGSTIILTVSWTSGVEPCNVLDHVAVTPGPGSYAITLREGHGPEDIACIAIAELKKTEVSIPNVPAGTYQITDGAGGATPIEITVG